MGTAKATVFPEPVLLPPMTSLPPRISGIQPFWMAVGLLISMAASEAISHGATSSVAKLDFASTTLPLCTSVFSIFEICAWDAWVERGLIREVVGKGLVGLAELAVLSESGSESLRLFLVALIVESTDEPSDSEPSGGDVKGIVTAILVGFYF